MLQAYEGYLVNGQFFPLGTPVALQGRKRAIVTILDDVVSDDVSRKLKELDELNAMVDASSDEEVPSFERARLHREVEL